MVRAEKKPLSANCPIAVRRRFGVEPRWAMSTSDWGASIGQTGSEATGSADSRQIALQRSARTLRIVGSATTLKSAARSKPVVTGLLTG